MKYTHTGSTPNGVSPAMYTDEGSKWRAADFGGFNDDRFSLNTGPFRGVGLVAIGTPDSSSMMELQLLFIKADQGRYDSIMGGSYSSLPLQITTSSDLEEQQYEHESDAYPPRDEYGYDHNDNYDYESDRGTEQKMVSYQGSGLFTVREGAVLSLVWVIVLLCMLYCGAGSDHFFQPTPNGFVRPIIDAQWIWY